MLDRLSRPQGLIKLHEGVLCQIFREVVGRLLTQYEVDPKAVSSCIETWCNARLAGPSAQELAEREGTA
jgi:hypothetical protein